MIPALQKMTICLLALLQLAAPLVHAHSGMEAAGLGVHIPGLESWSVGANEDAVSSDSDYFRSNNCVVAVSSAIKQKHLVSVEPAFDGAADFPADVYTVATDSCLLNFSPQYAWIVSTPPVCSHGTRAPPVIRCPVV